MNYGGHPLVILRTAIENRPLIVDLAMKGDDFPGRYVSLPEAMSVLNSLTLGRWTSDGPTCLCRSRDQSVRRGRPHSIPGSQRCHRSPGNSNSPGKTMEVTPQSESIP